MLVVRRYPEISGETFKVFERVDDAFKHAGWLTEEDDAQRADVFEVSLGEDVPDAEKIRAAVDFVKAARGTLIRSFVPKFTGTNPAGRVFTHERLEDLI
jgi:hypothetical protein